MDLMLAEWVGAFIGDGFTNLYNGKPHTEIAGDPILDKDYYETFLIPVAKERLDSKVNVYTHSGSIRLKIYQMHVYDWLTQELGFTAGKKCYDVKIPRIIMTAGNPVLMACLRGMFDTDGGVFFDKRKAYREPYVRVCYTSASPALMKQVAQILQRLGIRYSMHQKADTRAEMIQINGKKNVEQYLQNIGFRNERHLAKLQSSGLARHNRI